ncbi:xanthine dehydrogenase family protein molybdopterin-binding subunit [Pseudonocardia phyllosphaerae]|uniref:xanthine dehydrogenase family protein molybdopterin-binding subunit n=1 Tax=Pseudonocardia phyllosphaerae TaxID=3390502 RepID=UPI00397BA88D
MSARLEAPLKVTGRARYGSDNTPPGTVFGYVVTSTIAAGEVEAMDVAAAETSPGVLAVYTPFAPLELTAPQNPMLGTVWVPLQDTEVNYHGQPIGFVVAQTYEQARDAAGTIAVTYRERPAVTSMSDGLATAEQAPPAMDGSPAELEVLAEGVESFDDALAAAPVVVEATYATATQNHAAMEPHSAVAVWDDGVLTLYTGNQASDLVAVLMADALGVEHDAVHVLNPYVGGAFGGKAVSPPAFLAAAAARVLGLPVKAALTREQVFTATSTRPATVQKLSVGAEKDGTLVALRHDSWSSTPMARAFVEPTSHGTSREWYATPNLSISQKMVPLNVPTTSFMRAPGEAPGSFALESAIDELAVALDMDPIELRLRNSSVAPPGRDLQWSSKHLDDCFALGAARFGWSARAPQGRVEGDWQVGVGVATAMFPALRFPASVRVTLRDDDTAEVATSGADPGTGLLTVLSLVTGETLDIDPARVTPRLGDSALPAGGFSGGSTATASAGSAIMIAGPQVIDRLLEAAAGPGGPFAGADVTYADGRVFGPDGATMTFGEVLRATGQASVAAVGSSAAGEELTKHSFSSFGAQFCEVRVHRWTREIRVSRMLGVFDAGRIINPQAARSQISGGMIWGVSAALHEGLEVERTGRFANGDFASYLIPVNADIPEIDVEFVHHPDTLHNPVGARGLGEIGVVGMAAAVANAVANATGVRVRHIPIMLEDLLDD